MEEKYEIMETGNRKDLVKYINSMIMLGWECQGGVSVCMVRGGIVYTQAMIKKD